MAFTVALMRKDLDLALPSGREVGVDMAATRAADDVLARAAEQGLEDADFASVASVIRKR